MVAGRTQRDKRIFDAAAHDLVDSHRHATHAMRDCRKTLRAHGRVGIEVDPSARGSRGLDRIDIVRGVNAQDRPAIDPWRIRPDQRREARVFEGLRYHPDTVRTFWMTMPGIVSEIR